MFEVPHDYRGRPRKKSRWEASSSQLLANCRSELNFRLDENLELFGRSQAEPGFVDLQDAGAPFAQQLQSRSAAESHRREAGDFAFASAKRKHAGLIASPQVL